MGEVYRRCFGRLRAGGGILERAGKLHLSAPPRKVKQIPPNKSTQPRVGEETCEEMRRRDRAIGTILFLLSLIGKRRI